MENVAINVPKSRSAIMPARKRRSSKGQVKPKEKALKKPVLDFSDLVHKGIQNEPLGKAISALNILYSELDDMEMRMNILISRIEILKTRTKELRNGKTLSLQTLLSDILPEKSRDSASKLALKNLDREKFQSEPTGEWTKLKLKEDTTINDVMLAAKTTITLNSKAAANLIENGVAEVVETSTEEPQTPNTSK